MSFRLKPVLLSAMLLASFAAQAQSIRPGLWEMQGKMGGNPEMDAAMAQMQQQLASMPPAQRKQMEQMMAAQGMKLGSGGKGMNISVQTCVTPEQAKRAEMPTQTEGNCKTTVVSRSSSLIKVHFECTNPTSTGDAEYRFQSDKAFQGTVVTQSMHNGKSMSSTIQSSGKWLGDSCGNVGSMGSPGK